MAPILSQFASAPYRFLSLFVANTHSKAKTLVLDADLGAPHDTNPFDSTGIFGLAEVSSTAQWDDVFGTAPGQQNRPNTRRNRPTLTVPILQLVAGMPDHEVKMTTSLLKSQTRIVLETKVAYAELLESVIASLPPELLASYTHHPTPRTITTILAECTTRWGRMPDDILDSLQIEIDEIVLLPDEEPEDFIIRLNDAILCLPAAHQTTYTVLRKNALLSKALRDEPDISTLYRLELFRFQPATTLRTWNDACLLFNQYTRLGRQQKSHSSVSYTAAASIPPPTIPTPAEPAEPTFSPAQLAALTAIIQANQSTAPPVGRSGGGGRGAPGSRSTGRGGRGASQARPPAAAAANPPLFFCFVHHDRYPHSSDTCRVCATKYPPATFPAVYRLRAPGRAHGVQSGEGVPN
jgi:hypothetical protein